MSEYEKNIEVIAFYIKKADDSFNDAQILAANNGWNGCANRLYYACFFIVYAALLSKVDLKINTYSDIKALFGLHFIKTGLIDKNYGEFYTNLFKLRGDADYGDFTILTSEDVEPFIKDTHNFIAALQQILKTD